MMRRILPLPAIVLLVGGLLPSAANANDFRQMGKPYAAASAFQVAPPMDWNMLSAKPGKKAETWTLDGEMLNNVTFYGGIDAGESLIKEYNKKLKPLPKLTPTTLLVEIPEILEATYRSARDVPIFTTTDMKPDTWLGQEALRFTYEFTDTEGLPRKGIARAALRKGKLYMMTFDAPRLHFFEQSLPAFLGLTEAVAVK